MRKWVTGSVSPPTSTRTWWKGSSPTSTAVNSTPTRPSACSPDPWSPSTGVKMQQSSPKPDSTRCSGRGGPREVIPEHVLGSEDPVNLATLLRDVFGLSGSEARRLIDQGAVRVDDQVVTTTALPRSDLAGSVVRVGKRRFARLVD